MNKGDDGLRKNYLVKEFLIGLILPGLLILLNYNYKTYKVVIKNTVLKGKLDLKKDKFINVQMGEEGDREPVYKFLNLSSTEFFLEPFNGDRKEKIDRSRDHILLESAKRIDDSNINIKKTNKKGG